MYQYTCDICGKTCYGQRKSGKYCQPEIGQSKSRCQMQAIRILERERQKLKPKKKDEHKHSRAIGDWIDHKETREAMIQIKQVEIEALAVRVDLGKAELSPYEI